MENQTENKNPNRIKILRFLFAVLAVYGALCLLGDLAAWGIHMYGGVSLDVTKATSIGIIGGADGPTAIFVTASAGPVWATLGKLLVLLTGIFGWRNLRDKK